MFCPQCAAENTDNSKYCRACRQNLKVVSQVMNQSLPLVLASKLDAYLERANERLLRDGILNFLVGIYFFAGSIWKIITEPHMWDWYGMTLLIACYNTGFSIWSMLAYRRSLSLSAISAKTTSTPDSIYCPRCAESNEKNTKFCSKCGENLKVVSQAMSSRLPASIINRLDRHIAKRSWNSQGQIIWMGIPGLIALFFGILWGIQTSFYFGLIGPLELVIIGCLVLIFSAFDLITEKRRSYSISQAAELQSSKNTAELGLHSPAQISMPASVTEAITKRLDEQPTKHLRKEP